MKKVLYIDADAPIGHVNFNRIWLSSLVEYPIDLTTCMPQQFHDKIGVTTRNISIPDRICGGKGPIGWRVFSMLRLLWIRVFVPFKKYDIVILSSFENATFAFVRFFFSYGNIFCVCHNNIEQAKKNSGHRFLLKFLSKRVSLIALNNAMKQYLDSVLNAPKTFCIQHGFPPSFSISPASNAQFLAERFPGKNVIFIPSLTSTSDAALIQIQQDHHLVEKFKRNKIQFVISKKIPVIEPDCFFSFPDRLSDDEYLSVFQQSKAILLLYPESFFRISAILHEAIINNKILFLPDYAIFADYKNIIPREFFYQSLEDLAGRITKLSDLPDTEYHIPDNMSKPDFSDLLNSSL